MAGVAVSLVLPALAPGHTGRRLRLGFRGDPLLAALAILTEIYLEEVSGFQLDLREYADPARLDQAFREGEVDLLLEYPARVPGPAAPTDRPAPGEMGERDRRAGGEVWIGPYRAGGGEPPRQDPVYRLSAGVADDLAYYTLPDYLGKLTRTIGGGDLTPLLARDPTGRDRGLLRDLLAAKRLI
jgi:hypothetical protein